MVTLALSRSAGSRSGRPRPPLGVTFAVGGALALIELSGPVIAERGEGGTPWHAHHIAERYGLLVIITLGEGIIGTVASLAAVVPAPRAGASTPAWSRWPAPG